MRLAVALLVLTSLACTQDADLPWADEPRPAVTPVGPAAVVEPEVEVEPEPGPLLLPPSALPAHDRRDQVLRRSLDPGDCPEGTRVLGRAPPAGLEQYCGDAEGTRFGPARLWPEDALPSSGGYIPGKNFRPIHAASYHGGELDGASISWWPTGGRQSLSRYDAGVSAGIWASWDESGVMQWQRNYFEPAAPPPPELLVQTGPSEAWAYGSAYLHTDFFDDGQPATQRIQLDDDHELLAGFRSWFNGGGPKCRADQLPDRVAEHVRWVCWHDNGTKKEEGNKRAGRAHGEWSEWAKNGSLRVKGSYFDGKKTGTWERTNARGKKKIQNYPVPIAQALELLPKTWTEVFKSGNTVVLRPDCGGVSRTMTIADDHLIVAAGEDSQSYLIEQVIRDEEDAYTLALAGKQSIWVLYKGKGTAALWKRATAKLADAEGIYVPTLMVPSLGSEPPTCE